MHESGVSPKADGAWEADAVMSAPFVTVDKRLRKAPARHRRRQSDGGASAILNGHRLLAHHIRVAENLTNEAIGSQIS